MDIGNIFFHKKIKKNETKMKNKQSLMLSLIAVLLMIMTFSSCKKGDDPTPPPPTDNIPPTTPTNFVGVGQEKSVSLSWTASTDNVGVKGYILRRDNAVIANVLGGATTYIDNGLADSTLYKYTIVAIDNSNNYSTPSSEISVWTLGPTLTAIFTGIDASSTLPANEKILYGNSVAKGVVLDVATAGIVKIETFGTLTNGENAIDYFWARKMDDVADINYASSTFNPTISKRHPLDIATSSQKVETLNLDAGKYIFSFKVKEYSGLIPNGTQIGIKITGKSGASISSLNYISNGTEPNLAKVIKIKQASTSGLFFFALDSHNGSSISSFYVYPYSDENGNMYDGNKYPYISAISFDMKDTSWLNGGNSVGKYDSLDFSPNVKLGQNYLLKQFNEASVADNIFSHVNANYSVDKVISLSKSTPHLLVKGPLGNFAMLYMYVNVDNNATTQWGPYSGAWKVRSIKFKGNPEVWFYSLGGNSTQRIL